MVRTRQEAQEDLFRIILPGGQHIQGHPGSLPELCVRGVGDVIDLHSIDSLHVPLLEPQGMGDECQSSLRLDLLDGLLDRHPMAVDIFLCVDGQERLTLLDHFDSPNDHEVGKLPLDSLREKFPVVVIGRHEEMQPPFPGRPQNSLRRPLTIRRKKRVYMYHSLQIKQARQWGDGFSIALELLYMSSEILIGVAERESTQGGKGRQASSTHGDAREKLSSSNLLARIHGWEPSSWLPTVLVHRFFAGRIPPRKTHVT